MPKHPQVCRPNTTQQPLHWAPIANSRSPVISFGDLLGCPLGFAGIPGIIFGLPGFSVNPRSPMELEEPPRPFEQTLIVTFPSAKEASVVYRSLEVDKEIRPDRVSRELILADECVLAKFAAKEIRFLRVAISAFLQNMALVIEVVATFPCVNTL
ncbi:hypothetical protein AAMO2058_000445400 [Amorphochlora amoebiformis]